MSRTPANTPSDEELACLAQQGCATSFEQLVRRFQTPVLHFLRHRGAGADAEDLLQETFVRAYTQLHRYEPRWRFATWLFTIARRISINEHRRPRLAVDAAALGAAISSSPEPVDSIVEEEDRQRLWGLAARILSEEELTALWLYYVEDLPVRDVAAVVERSWVVVKAMLFRARKKLYPLLAALEADDSRRCGRLSSVPANHPRDVEACHVKTKTLP
jgi:RNA polymerase sigma-70 factor (ECF subfamily)